MRTSLSDGNITFKQAYFTWTGKIIETLERIKLVFEICVATGGLVAALYLLLGIAPQLSLPLHRRAGRFAAAAGFFVAAGEALPVALYLFPEGGSSLPVVFAREVFWGLALVFVFFAALSLRRSERDEVAPLRLLADMDPLTTLHNQAFFRRAAQRWIARSREHDLPLTLAMLDIDDFKSYNDQFGHEAGNIVLRRVAQVLKESVRADDLLARYGGEEFVILMNANQKEAAEAVERIRLGVESQCSPREDGSVFRQITVSIGVAPLTSRTVNVGTLIDAADSEMYLAKQAGKNKVYGSEAVS